MGNCTSRVVAASPQSAHAVSKGDSQSASLGKVVTFLHTCRVAEGADTTTTCGICRDAARAGSSGPIDKDRGLDGANGISSSTISSPPASRKVVSFLYTCSVAGDVDTSRTCGISRDAAQTSSSGAIDNNKASDRADENSSSTINSPLTSKQDPSHTEGKIENKDMTLEIAADLSNIVEESASDDSDLCPTVIMNDRTIEIVNTMSSSTGFGSTDSGGKSATRSQKYHKKPFHWLEVERPGLGHLVTAVSRITIIVSDIERSVVFYEQLGFEQDPSAVNSQEEASLVGSTLELQLKKGQPVAQSGENPVVGHLSLYVPKAQEAIQLLRQTDIPFVVKVGRSRAWEVDHCKHFLRQAFIRDPDGYYIEICNCQAAGSPAKCAAESETFDLHQIENFKSVTVSTMVRRWLTYSDLRASQSDAEVELTLHDETVNTLFQSSSDGNITGPNGLFDVAAKSKRNQSLIRSKSNTYVDVLKANGIPLEVESANDASEELNSGGMATMLQLVESVNYISLVVSNARKSLKFYRDILGLQQIQSMADNSQGTCLFAGNMIINIIEGKPEVEPGGETAVDGNITLDVVNIKEAYKKLQEMKVPFRVKTTGRADEDKGLSEACIRDPDGNVIGIGNYKSAASASKKENAESHQQRSTRLSTEAKHEVKPLPLELQPTVADPRILQNFMMRQEIDGDICHHFKTFQLKKILCEAGNDAPIAILLMKQQRMGKDPPNESIPKEGYGEIASALTLTDPASAGSSMLCCGCYKEGELPQLKLASPTPS